MLQKLVGIGVFVLGLHLLVKFGGAPSFGTVGFLILINLFHLSLFIAYQAKLRYTSQFWATAFAFFAILASLVSLFRANPHSQVILGYTSLVMSVFAYYFYTLTFNVSNKLIDFLLLPINLVVSWVGGLKFLLFRSEPKTQTYGVLTLLLVVAIGILGWQSMSLEIFSLEKVFLNQYIGLLLLFIFLFVGVFARSNSLLKTKFSSDFFSTAYNEVMVLVFITIVVLLGFIVSRFKYFFGIGDLAQLSLYGDQSVSSYLHHGLIELVAFGLVIYSIAEISGLVLSCTQKKGWWLRGLDLVIISLFLAPFISVIKRFYWYVSLNGWSNVDFFVALFLFLSLVLFVILIVRFLIKEFEHLKVTELVFWVVFVIGLGLVNVDYLLAKYHLQNTDPDSIDYVYLTEFSPDAVEVWLESYLYAKNSLRDLDVTSKNYNLELSSDQISQIQGLLSNLRKNYYELAQFYGTRKSAQILNPNLSMPSSTLDSSIVRQVSIANLAEWNAYRVLRDQIPPEELVQLEQLSNKLETKRL